MSSIKVLKDFDKSQLWRFFVDGRLHKKYNGWVGYEAGEKGSIQALLNGFSFMLDNFDLSTGLKGTYLRELHKVCMLNVGTSNLKSSPGDIRYLNSGIPFFAKSTTYEHLLEVFEMRTDDGTALFNHQKYAKTANELDVKEIYAFMLKQGKINYRNWYPNLDNIQQNALEGKDSLHAFYEAKHTVQILIISKMEDIIERYNQNIQQAKTEDEKLAVIALVPREMELLHPFPDGNSRTFSCITLTHLLLYHGLKPALLENPNLDNEVSLSQWIVEIKKGMDRTKELLLEPNKRMFEYSILDMTKRDRDKFLGMAAELINKIETQKEIYLTPQRIKKITKGEWIKQGCDENIRFTGVGTYGTYTKGNIYFAIAIKDWIKEKKNPHDELKKMLKNGIKALVLDDLRYAKDIHIPILWVQDSFKAFKQCAIQVRQDKNPFTILITGTEGKTGAKVQFHHLLDKQIKTHAVLNSANTEIPVLRSLINLEADDEVEVNEVSVGSDEAYRVERSVMVNPDLCFFTHIGPNHMDMHKTIENIMVAKSSVVEGLRVGGKCILNSKIEHYPKLLNAINNRKPDIPILTYGTLGSDTATLVNQVFDSQRFGWNVEAMIDGESLHYFVPMFQQHAPLASVGVLLAIKEMGYDIHQAAKDYDGCVPFETMGRMLKLSKRSGNVLFYDQSRRGGFHGMRSAFEDMKNFVIDGKIVALVGGISIKKDSQWTREAHAELANMINESKIDRLYTTGNFMDYMQDNLTTPSIFVKHSDDLDDLASSLYSEVKGGDLLFIIGSAYLYLGRVSDRLLRLKDRSKFDHGINQTSLSSQLIHNYKIMLVLDDVEKGCPLGFALKQNEIDDFPSHKLTYTQIRAGILMVFFKSLDKLVLSFKGLSLVNQEIIKTGNNAYVYNHDFCQQWFNNVDKKENLPRKQLFGSFYFFGDKNYLLHIEVATMNLHIGFVKYHKIEDNCQVLKMELSDYESITEQYGACFDKGMKFAERSWGLKWYSHDYGNFIDLANVTTYSTMVDLLHSELSQKNLIPLLELLRKTNKFKK
jgi:UDP-N-acetylmuramoyl-tripeptide--D-alanyl-D-alanine ligase